MLVVAAQTRFLVGTSNSLVSTVARSYWLTCCTGTRVPVGLPQAPPHGLPHGLGPHPIPPGTIVVVTRVRVSTPSTRTRSRPCAPVPTTAATNDASDRLGSSSRTVWPATASTPAARSFPTKMSSNTRASAALPAVPETTSLRIGGPGKSESNHADRIEVFWHPETSAASATSAASPSETS